jgi:hypothetical protein
MEKVESGNRYDVMMTYCSLIRHIPWSHIISTSTHSLSTPLNPFFGVLLGDASTDLHAVFPRTQRFFSRVVISRTEHDDVCAFQAMLFVQVGVVCGGVFGRPIRLEHIGCSRGQRAADNLLDAAGVQVYTRSKARHVVSRVEPCRMKAGEAGVRTEVRNAWQEFFSATGHGTFCRASRLDYIHHNGARTRKTEAHQSRGA